MCGIAGIITKKSGLEMAALTRMCDALLHRGPDGAGTWFFDNTGIGHRRLSIIDPALGHQPLVNQSGTLCISFNGELYNYLDLKKELKIKGHQFRTNSDTEVVLLAYEEWGDACVNKFRGMFAFSILDTAKRELFLVRDHFGIKPLFYYQDEKYFAFASEIQALKKVDSFKTELDLGVIDQYLCLKYINAPNTIYTFVKKIEPGHFMRVDLSGNIIEYTQYWKPEFVPDYSLNEVEWLDGLDNILMDSVRAHLVSDVSFGAFLSGGIDSSLVVSYMSRIMSEPVKTFSIGFDKEDFNELPYAEQVARYWKTDHHYEIIKPDALSILPLLVKHYGEPFGDISAVPTYYVSRLASSHVKMVLSGDAGDELFAGYESYTKYWSREISPIPHHLPLYKKIIYSIFNKIMPQRFPLRDPSFGVFLKDITGNDGTTGLLWNKDYREALKVNYFSKFQNDFQYARKFGHFQKAQFVDFMNYLPGDVLAKVDIASMMNSLEVRTPLLDVKVAEFAFRIPEGFNIRKVSGQYQGKILLKKTLGRYFDESFINRPKRGFAVPADYWFSAETKEGKNLAARILEPGGNCRKYFDFNSLKHSIQGSRKEMLWKLLVLDEWLEQNKA